MVVNHFDTSAELVLESMRQVLSGEVSWNATDKHRSVYFNVRRRCVTLAVVIVLQQPRNDFHLKLCPRITKMKHLRYLKTYSYA